VFPPKKKKNSVPTSSLFPKS